MKFESVTADKVGTVLKHGETYTCLTSGNIEIRARFEYCSDEYWWVNEHTNSVVGVRLFMRNQSAQIPKPKSKWQHHNGCKYEVIAVANLDSEREEYPITVVYKGVNGEIWSKPLVGFLSRMKAT